MISPVQYLHQNYIMDRRAKVLARLIGSLLSDQEEVLDVGCGDGRIASLVLVANTTLSFKGVDPVVRSESFIDVNYYDGSVIPFGDNTFDTGLLIDVLHHTTNPEKLIREVIRVSRNYIIIKDVVRQGSFSYALLKYMDIVGNRRFKVPLPFNFLPKQEWDRIFRENNLEKVFYADKLGIYAFPLTLIFDGNLHFINKLKINKQLQA